MVQETFYKVCSVQQIVDKENSRTLENYLSLNRRPDCMLKYELGKITKAPRGTALFAFENFSNAEEYLAFLQDSFQSIESLVILKGMGTKYKYKVPDKIPSRWATYYFKKFWKEIRHPEYSTENIARSELVDTPATFVFLSSFKPLQVVLQRP